MHYHWGQMAAKKTKKKRGHLEQRTSTRNVV